MVEDGEDLLIWIINDKISSGDLRFVIKPYGEIRKSKSVLEHEFYGQYYIWDNYINHLMAGDVCLDRLAALAGLACNQVDCATQPRCPSSLDIDPAQQESVD